MTLKKLLKKIVPFGKKVESGTQAQTSRQANVYRSCGEIPLEAFIDATVNGNHARILKCGKATPYQIDEAWKNLYSEYCDISDTKPYKHLFALNKEIGQLHGRLLQVRVCLKVLSIHYVRYCEVSLQNMGYYCTLDPANKEEYDKTLKAINQKSKTIELALMEKKKEHANAIAEYGGKDITEADFTRNLVELSSYMKFRINPKEITVLEYVEIRKKYDAEAEYIEKQNNKT